MNETSGDAGDDDCSLQFSCLFLKYFEYYFPITSQYILCTIGLFSLIGNGIILGTILTKHTRERKGPNRQNQENGLIANLYFGSISLADILATLFYLPSQVYVNFSQQWQLGKIYCKLHI